MKIRIRISLDVSEAPFGADATPAQVKAALGPIVQFALTQNLPDTYKVDTAVVTRANIAVSATQEGSAE